MRIPHLIRGLLLAACAGVCVAMTSAPGPSGAVKIVVHASNPAAPTSRDEIARIFLKKKTTFSDGRPAVPVDLDENSAVRRAFSKDILGRDISSVLTYWQEMIFSGRGTPPAQRTSDADVLDFVRGNPNGIGYVSGATDTAAGVRVLSVS